MPVAILGTGRYVPRRVLTNHDLENMVDTSDEWILKRTGIRERHIAAPEETLVFMAEDAARKALGDAGIAAEDIGLIVCATSSPDLFFPSVAARLQHRLGAVNAACFDISAACTGFVTAFDTADAFLRTDKCKKALVVATERISDVTDYSDRTTCILFGDAAASFVLGIEETAGLVASFLACKGEGWENIYAQSGGYMVMNGKEVYKSAVHVMQEAMEAVLAKAGRGMDEVRWIIPHQANLRILESVMQKWDLPESKVLISLPYTGNTSSATIPSLYDEHRRNGAIRRGDLVLMVAFGAGMTYGALLYEA